MDFSFGVMHACGSSLGNIRGGCSPRAPSALVLGVLAKSAGAFDTCPYAEHWASGQLC